MIDIKGTRETHGDPTASSPYAFPVADEKSRGPAHLALLLLGVLAYIRSAVSLFGPMRQEGVGPATEVGPQSLDLAAVDTGVAEMPKSAIIQPLERVAAIDIPDLQVAGNVVVFPQRLVHSPALHLDLRQGSSPQAEPPAPGTWQPPAREASNMPFGSGNALGRDLPTPDDGAGSKNPEPPEQPDERNRRPVAIGPLRLNEAFAGTAVMIALSELLANVTDADGDTLAVRNLRVSGGSIGTVEGGFVFSTNAANPTTEIAIHYEVFDGEAAVPHVAYIPVLRNPVIFGSEAGDVLVGTSGTDHIDALGGGDLVSSGTGDDVVLGGMGDDHIIAGAGRDIVLAGQGDDIVFAGAGDDLVAGGEGSDSLYGEEGADTLLGENGDDRISGGDGDDWLSGGAGDDRLAGDAGDDRIEGGAGDDTLIDGTGNDVLLGGEGDDTVVATLDGEADVFEGSAGFDRFDLSAAKGQLAIDLVDGTATGVENGADRISGFEAIYGGAGDDHFRDGAGPMSIFAGGGDDLLIAAADASDDRFEGGDGEDTLDCSVTAEGIIVDLVQGLVSGIEIGEDSISGFETFVGGGGNDVFQVGQSSVTLKGGEGADLFCFEMLVQQSQATQLVHDILDFVAGDRVLVGEYEFTFSRSEEYQDRFAHYYRDRDEADDELELRIRHRTENGQDLTVFDFDHDGDLELELTIILIGHHQPLIYDSTPV